MSKFKHPPRNIDVRPDFVIKDKGSTERQGLLSQYGLIGAAQLMFKQQMKKVKIVKITKTLKTNKL